jgi:hypothetical protein
LGLLQALILPVKCFPAMVLCAMVTQFQTSCASSG